jgi:hypothetical protein
MKKEFKYIDGKMMENKSKEEEEPCSTADLCHATKFKCQVGPIDSHANRKGNGK